MNYSKKTNNSEVRTKLRNENLYYWQIADALGVCENTFCRMLRHELPEEEKQKILEIIDQVAKGEVKA